MKLSIVTTLYQSESFIEEFVRRVSAEVSKITEDYEIILVDDGSPDRSLEIACGIQKSNPRVAVIELSRNFGHHRAMMTGLAQASGERVFLIDVDLEEPPELLGDFRRQMEEGSWDVVYGVQKNRHGFFIKRVLGALGWGLIDRLLPIRIPRNHCTVRLMKSDYVRQLLRHREQMTAIGGLWVLTGFRQTGFVFDKGSRNRTSYSFFRRLGILTDSVTSFSEKPLYGVFFLGLGMFFLSMLVAAYFIYVRLTGTVLPGWISVMVSVWTLGGLILLSLGLVGIYVSRIFIETKQRPYTIIRNQWGPLQQSKD